MDTTRRRCSRCGRHIGRDVGDGVCAACLLGDVWPAAEGFSGAVAAQDLGTDVAAVQRFGPYELLEEVGRGGMGVIYKARQPGLDRIVALKMLLAGEFADARARERLLREAKIAARLMHPGIVTIHEVGEHGGRPYFAMEYVPGCNLAQFGRDGLLPVNTAVRYVEQLARAVHYAHQQGVIHRDLKPANVLLGPDDEPKLTDFGLTKSTVDPTRTIESAGSPNFMAPEQADSSLGATGTHTDVFGLGALLYYLLTGRPPALGETLSETLRAVAACEPVPPVQLRPALPRDLDTIALRCLEKEPARRYRSALEVAEELARWRNHEPIRARPAGAAERVQKWVRRRPVVAAWLGAFFLAVLFGVAGITWQWRRAETQRALTEEEGYVASLQLAQQYLQEGQIERARERLLATPERLRHVEWGRLMAQCFSTLAKVFPSATSEGRNPWVDRFDGRVATGGEHLVTWGGNVTQLWRTRDGRELQRWDGTQGPADPAEFSPDGKFLLMGGPGQGFSMWDVAGGKQVFAGATNGPKCDALGFSPDGRSFYTLTDTRRAELWDSRTGALLRRLPGGHDAPGWLQFSSDGTRIWDNPVQTQLGRTQAIWSTETGEPVATLPPNPSNYLYSSLSPGAEFYAAVTVDQAVEVWKVGGSEPIFRTPAGTGPYQFPGVTRDGSRLVAMYVQKNGGELWNIPERRLVTTLGERINLWRFTPDDRFVLAGGAEQFIPVWDVHSGEQVQQINTGQAGAGSRLSTSPDGRFLISTGIDDSVVVCPIHSTDRTLRYEAWAVSAAFSPDTTKIVAPYLEGKLLLWDLASGAPRHLHGHRQWVTTAEFSPDGRRIYSGSVDTTLKMWNAVTGELLGTATNHTRAIVRLLLSRDGSKLFSSDWGGQLWIWDARTLAPLRTIQIQDPGQGGFFVDVHPEGNKILANSAPGVVEWDAESGQRLWEISGPFVKADYFRDYGMAYYSPDGTRFVLEANSILQLWERRPLRLLAEARQPGTFSRSIFTPDGLRLLTVCVDSDRSAIGKTTIEVRDARTLKRLVGLAPMSGTGLDIRLSPNQRWMSRTRIDDSALGAPIEVWRVFPWREADYPGLPGEPWDQRLLSYAARQWEEVGRRPLDLAQVQPAEPWIPPRQEWPARDPRTPRRCVDLTAHYNRWLDSAPVFVHYDRYSENHLAGLPRGLHFFDDIPFDIRGVVAGGAEFHWARLQSFQPADTLGIPVGQTCRQLHFLHCASVIQRTQPLVARYRLHYVNGETRDLEMSLDQDVVSWWGSPGEAAPAKSLARIVWRGTNPSSELLRQEVRVGLRTWDNPLPGVEIRSLDFLSEKTRVNPLLIALTVE